MVLLNLWGEMKGLELMGLNGIIGKLRDFKEITKMAFKRSLGSKCNFAKTYHGTPATACGAQIQQWDYRILPWHS